jgi:hypothetical protein
MHARVAGSWHDGGMNVLIAEKPAPSKKDDLVASEPMPRPPLAAALLPYGLSLESLLRP